MKISSLWVSEFEAYLNTGEYTLIDVRTEHEQSIFWIIQDTQIHIDVYKADAAQKIQELPREKKYLIYCYHGNRTKQVLAFMQELGFQEAYDLEGGIDAWKKYLKT